MSCSQAEFLVDKDVRGRLARPYPYIPDTFKNVVKALVKPVKREDEDDTGRAATA